MNNYFVDFSAAENGDGSDGAQAGSPGGEGAWNQFTSTELVEVEFGDRVWFRRTGSGDSKPLSFKAGSLIGLGMIEYNGWPVDADDAHFELSRTVGNSVEGTWDSDGEPFVVVDPHGAAVNKRFSTYRRIHWFADASQANEPFADNGFDVLVFYKCKGTRTTAVAPQIRHVGDGFVVWDDVHVEGTAPATANADRPIILGGTNCRALARLRFTYTAAGTQQIGLAGTTGVTTPAQGFSSGREKIIEILEFNDAGDREFFVVGQVGGSGPSPIWMSDSDSLLIIAAAPELPPIPFNRGARSSPVNQGTAILRNLDLRGSTTSTTTLLSVSSDSTLIVEDCIFPGFADGFTAQVNAGVNNRAKFIGRNLQGVEHDLITMSDNADDSFRRYIHISGINGTPAWYRRMPGCEVRTTGVRRQGGAGYGITVTMLERSVANLHGRPDGGVFVSERPGMEVLTFPVAGESYPVDKKLTVYFAVTDWAGRENKNNIWVEVSKYRDVDSRHRAVIDTRRFNGKVLIPDGSTWESLDPYDAYRIEIPMTVVRDDIIQVRLYVSDAFNHDEMPGTFNRVYFDPAFVFEDV